MQDLYDVIVVGGGPAGLSAAVGAARSGAGRILVLEREERTGGVLNQCIHDGFGLVRYKRQLSGPEYAARMLKEASIDCVEIRTREIAIRIEDGDIKTIVAVSRYGLTRYRTRSIVLALGCRERTRGMIQIPGTRPAGVYTAGVVQNLLNTKNILAGRRVVILGSGDIGLIMARRLTLEGAKVLAVVEIMEKPCGLARNISQCLYDWDIPLYLGHTISRIYGDRRLDGVDVCPVDETKKPISGKSFHLDCDTLVLSVGLIPENELSLTAGIKLGRGNETITDECLQTSVKGIFSCGNSRSVMDLADYVSMQGELAGSNAAKHARGLSMEPWAEELSNPMRKGLPDENCYTCTFCPNGCCIRRLGVGEYSGNRCSRGIVFAKQEETSPERILTTTVKTDNVKYPLVAIRTDRPVKRSEMKSIIQSLNHVCLHWPVKSGFVVAKEVGVNKVTVFVG